MPNTIQTYPLIQPWLIKNGSGFDTSQLNGRSARRKMDPLTGAPSRGGIGVYPPNPPEPGGGIGVYPPNPPKPGGGIGVYPPNPPNPGGVDNFLPQPPPPMPGGSNWQLPPPPMPTFNGAWSMMIRGLPPEENIRTKPKVPIVRNRGVEAGGFSGAVGGGQQPQYPGFQERGYGYTNPIDFLLGRPQAPYDNAGLYNGYSGYNGYFNPGFNYRIW